MAIRLHGHYLVLYTLLCRPPRWATSIHVEKSCETRQERDSFLYNTDDGALL